MQFYSENKS